MVTVYTKNSCHPCKITKEILDKQGVTYRERRVDEDPEALAELKEIGYLQVPVVVAGEDHWSGLNPDKIKAIAA